MEKRRFLAVAVFTGLAAVVTLTLLFTYHTGEAPDKPIYVRLTWQREDTARSITVTWQTSKPDSGDTVLYDTVPRNGQSSHYRHLARGEHHTYPSASGHIHHVDLADLSPNTTYYFICGGERGGWSIERAFKTAPLTSSNVRFVAGGDCRTNNAERDKVSQSVSKFSPDFVLLNGDMVENGDVQSQWNSFFSHMDAYWVGTSGLTLPVIPAIGNHEEPFLMYYEQFALPNNEQWYSLNWGSDIHIIVLNSEAGEKLPAELVANQTVWLEEDLKSHAHFRWKFVMFHRNVFRSHHGSYDPALGHWASVFDRYHIDIVFTGHSHLYSRTKPINWTASNTTAQQSYENGTMYLITGGWGAPLHDDIDEWWIAHSRRIYHFVLVDIFQNGTLHMQAKDDTGATFDEVRIHKTPKVGLELINPHTEAAWMSIITVSERQVSYRIDAPAISSASVTFAPLVFSVGRTSTEVTLRKELMRGRRVRDEATS